jgi:hypothetical protein
MNTKKPILCLDFDGVIHSYDSGWKGAAVIPDPPVPGALDFIREALEHFEVHIFSSRSHQWGGKRAMKRWLVDWYREMFWARKDIQQAAGDPYSWTHADIDEDALQWGAHVVQQIHFPWFKPPAMVTLDDRALTFNGIFPKPEDLRRFKPWNKA